MLLKQLVSKCVGGFHEQVLLVVLLVWRGCCLRLIRLFKVEKPCSICLEINSIAQKPCSTLSAATLSASCYRAVTAMWLGKQDQKNGWEKGGDLRVAV